MSSALYRQGRLPVDRLMSERVGFEALNETFAWPAAIPFVNR